MVRPPCCEKLNYVSSKHGIGNGSTVQRKPESSTGLKRCGKSCKGRWNNESFTALEEELIIKLHAALGSRWAIIAHQLPGRSDNDIKNHWNTKLRKKLTEIGIDPVTHKPFSQILADYGKIGGLSRATGGGSRYIGTMKKDLKKVNSFSFPKPEPSSSSYNFISNAQDFTNNDDINTNNNSHSLDLLSQLQAISLVTEGKNSENRFQHESIEVPFSNSSLDFASGQVANSPESFSWHDFLLDEAVKPAQNQDQEQGYNDLGRVMVSSETANGEINANLFQGGSSSTIPSQNSSFMDAMLDQENDMFLNFPGLMEEPLY